MRRVRLGSRTSVSVLLVAVFSAALNVPTVRGSGIIYIRANGSIDPPATSISSIDNVTYTLTDNIFDSIVVERSDIVIDGGGYTIQGIETAYHSKGVYLSGISNVTIKNASIRGFWYGIYLNLVSRCSIYRNNVTTNSHGIKIEGSSNSIMHNNSVTSNEYYGVTLHSSFNNTLRDNNMTGNGYNFAVWGESLSGFLQDIDASNKVDGKPVYFWINRHNEEVPSNAGYIALINCSQITLKNLTLTNNGQKILMAYTDNSLMLNVQVSGSKTFSSSFSDVLMYNSNGNTIANSHFGSGINLTLSNYNILRDNIIAGFVTMIMSSVGNFLQNNTIINARWYGIIFWYSEDNTVRNNTIYNSLSGGIWLGLDSQNNTIENNNITQNGGSGINEYSKGRNCIRNNVVAYNGWDGIALFNYNVVINNTIVGNHVRGIISFSYNIISDNTVTSNNEWGVDLVSGHNVVEGNIIANNGLCGLYIGETGNSIIHNNFVSNNKQVILAKPDLSNVWDDSYPSGGNYWSDYNGTDLKSGPNQNEFGSDGIGDTPNTLSAANQDRYPLMSPMGSPQKPIASFTYSPQDPAKNQTITFNASTSYDRDGSIATYRWNFGDSNFTTVTTPTITHVYAAAWTYGVNLTVSDNDGLRHSTVKFITVTLDLTRPTTVHDYVDLWHTEDFTIALEATDDKSGIAEIYYKINNGPTRNVSTDGQPLITTEGASNKLEYWSTDKAGNEEIHHILTGIKLDKTAPAGSIIINNNDVYTNATSATLTLTATDGVSGIHQVRFSNDGAWDTEPWEHTSHTKIWTLANGDGRKTVYYQIKDNAGLVSTFSDSIVLDTTAPTANAGVNQTVNEGTLVMLDASASTDENGIANYTWTFTDKTQQTLTGKNPTYTFANSGTYTVTLRITDHAGNTATSTVTITVRTADGFLMKILGGVIIATGIAITAALIWKQRKHT